MNTLRNTILGLSIVTALAATAAAQNNPSNPCGGKAMKSAHAADSQGGKVFEVKDPMNRNSVTFKSTAPLEDIVGTSNEVSGHLVFDPTSPQQGGYGAISVPVASLNTGIPLRDEHLAGADWLNAEANANIKFEILEVTDVTSVKSTPDAQTFDAVAVGDFSLNGVTQRYSVPARITYLTESDATRQRLPGDLLAARATFEVALADFGITGPKGMDLIGSKVGETVEVEVSVVGSSASGAVAGNPCGGKHAMDASNPCGGK
jgi:polyisoprenoid-binding protein YceI